MTARSTVPVGPDRHAALDAAPPDIVLLAGVAAGDAASFEVFYRRHVDRCTQVARRHVPADASVDEVVQDVFLRVWHHAAHFDAGRASAGTWLLQITHNAAVDAARRQQRHRVRHRPLEVIAEPASTDPGPESVAVQRDTARAVWAAVGRLPPRQREPLHLAYVDDMTQRQIATHLDIPLGTVKTRTCAGLAQLRTCLLPDPRTAG